MNNTETNTHALGTVTGQNLWMAYSSNNDWILQQTPKGKRIQLVDIKGNEEIRIQYDENTAIVLNADGIILEGKQITLKSSEKTVTINQAEFDK